MNLHKFIEAADGSTNIINAINTTHSVLYRYKYPVVYVSGGSNSDIVLDIVHKLDDMHKVKYAYFNTGLEYQANKTHLDFLEDKYHIVIERVHAVKPVSVCISQHGYPFLSNFVSQKIAQLQRNNFDWSIKTYEEHLKQYPNLKNSLDWWYSRHSLLIWNIDYYKDLREFLCLYPPNFHVSAKCCYFAKKKPIERFRAFHNCDIQITGTRKPEGAVRSTLNSCLISSDKKGTVLRPAFFFTDADKAKYRQLFGITHSECYTKYGLKHTGCVGCPFNSELFRELDILRKFEPNLFQSVSNVFKKSYEYIKKFKEYRLQECDTTLNIPFEEEKS